MFGLFYFSDSVRSEGEKGPINEAYKPVLIIRAEKLLKI
jgi:hypothetical protein